MKNTTQYIYPEWHKQAVMEIELKSEDDEGIIPDGISVIKRSHTR